MAYAVKYRFNFQSQNGRTGRIDILKDGYAGSILTRRMGRAPVLKMEQNEHIHGTSLEMYLECRTDQEFAEFYTTDPLEWKVQLWLSSTCVWQGYISPELYSEPMVAPPYDVEVIATDGLGELKQYDFPVGGAVSLLGKIKTLLSYTGDSNPTVIFVSSLRCNDIEDDPEVMEPEDFLEDVCVNLDEIDAKNSYEGLQQILETLHADLILQNGAWCIVRETNAATWLNNRAVTLTKYGSGNYFPIDYLSTEVEPAIKTMTVTSSNNGGTVDFSNDLSAITIKEHCSSNPSGSAYKSNNAVWLFNTSTKAETKHAVYEASFPNGMTAREITIPAMSVYDDMEGTHSIEWYILVKWQGSSVTQYLGESGWQSTAPNTYTDPLNSANSSAYSFNEEFGDSQFQVVKESIPAHSGEGTLYVEVFMGSSQSGDDRLTLYDMCVGGSIETEWEVSRKSDGYLGLAYGSYMFRSLNPAESARAALSKSVELDTVPAWTLKTNASGDYASPARLYVSVKWEDTSDGNNTRYLNPGGWATQTANTFADGDFSMPYTQAFTLGVSRADYTVAVPALDIGEGKITVTYFAGGGSSGDVPAMVRVFHSSFGANDDEEWNAVVKVEGARGTEEYESLFGKTDIELREDYPFSQPGLPFIDDLVNMAHEFWDDNNQTHRNYISFIAIDYALSHAAPRIKTTGIVNMPASQLRPIYAVKGLVNLSMVNTFEWDLIDDEFHFEALTLPSLNMTIESITIKKSTK